MSYRATIAGLEGQDVQVQVSFWTGPKLLINGQPAPQGRTRGEMLLRRNDGSQATASWRPQMLGVDVPQLAVDGQIIRLVEPLKWYEWLWIGLPILMVFGGGALGAVAGVLGLTISARVMRMPLNGVVKYLLTGVITVLSGVVYLAAALLFSLLMQR
jgi:hypothetical protein